ncbi:hypothetical protein C3941_09630 [Kaistia algarum]|jgi:hypothetical protein|uniref:hypothetical protein n=1 Tax=Kaistia algarum TaxID=2083279 RepID=UPI000CE77859|nr:hypothetical protein [Kaistia algarum]MCX5512316.1 hypothetical protein [Kaistia algarum]PPE80407.1 hypothetical protein C3941_09630 [Kaistia algarum]
MEADNDAIEIAEQKRAALAYLTEAWDEAIAEGIEPDILAHAALFTALADLIDTYGEDAVADLTESLPGRVKRGEFTLQRTIQ